MKPATVFLLLLLSGCSGQPIEPNYYLLRPSGDLESRSMQPSEKFAMGAVAIAPYINQSSLLLKSDSGEMRPTRHHLWAEPMYQSVRNFLMAEISANMGRDIFPAELEKTATVIEVRLDQFHGTSDGKATLVAYWWLRRDATILSAYQFAQSRALDNNGYAALARAQQSLLSHLAKDIASSLENPTSS